MKVKSEQGFCKLLHTAVIIIFLFYFSDGYDLPNHGRQNVFPNGTLVIENTNKVHDEGFYTCTAFNSQEDSHTGTIQIEVLSKFYVQCH